MVQQELFPLVLGFLSLAWRSGSFMLRFADWDLICVLQLRNRSIKGLTLQECQMILPGRSCLSAGFDNKA